MKIKILLCTLLVACSFFSLKAQGVFEIKKEIPSADIDQASGEETLANSVVWQSFTATENGILQNVAFEHQFIFEGWWHTLTIFEGEGVAGQVLYTAGRSGTGGINIWWPWENMNISVTKNMKYTIAMTINPSVVIRPKSSSTDPYDGGISIFSSNTDLNFRATINPSYIGMSMDSLGFLGVNTQSPTATLDINGSMRIREGAGTDKILMSDGLGNARWDTITTKPNGLEDADNDTQIHVEKNSDEDIIRFDVAGNEAMTLDSNHVIIGDVLPGMAQKLSVGGSIFLNDTIKTIALAITRDEFLDVSIDFVDVIATSIDDFIWQSITPNLEGKLTEVAFRLHEPASVPDSLFIYAGEGTAGPMIHSQSFLVNSTMGEFHHVLIDQEVHLNAGQQYTIAAKNSSGFGWKYDFNNPYPQGKSSFGEDSDLFLKTYMFTIVHIDTSAFNLIHTEENGVLHLDNSNVTIHNGSIAATAFVGDGSGLTNLPTPPSTSLLKDDDGDTQVQVEESANENKIRFDAAGHEVLIIEDQQLSVDGNILLSGALKTPGSGYLDILDVDIDYVDTIGSLTAHQIWQSIVPMNAGQLSKIGMMVEFPFGGLPDSLVIYEGEGTAGAKVLSQPFIINGTSGSFVEVLMEQEIFLNPGQQYTIALYSETGVQWNTDQTNPYPHGRSSIFDDWDFFLKTYVASGSISDTADFDLIHSENAVLYLANSTVTIDDGSITANAFVGDGSGLTNLPSPTELFQVQTATNQFGLSHTDGSIEIASYVGSSNAGLLGTRTNHDLRFFTNNLVLMTLDVNGYVGIGTTTPTHPLHMASGAHVTTGGVWTNASDIAKKYDVESLNYGLAEVLKMRPTAYRYKADQSESIGFIAQEMEKIIPEAVSGEDGEKGIAYGLLSSVFANAMQEQQAEIDGLKAELKTLKEAMTKIIKSESK